MRRFPVIFHNDGVAGVKTLAVSPIRIRGTHRALGQQLGKLARPIMADYLAQSVTWQALQAWRGHAFIAALGKQVQQRLPTIWQELIGMAEALDKPLDDVLLWHCRGDVLHAVNEGCTTIAAHSGDSILIAHNEDGDPFLLGRCFMVEVELDDAPGFTSFYYPGSLPGHTFAVNNAGIVQTINNLRLAEPRSGVPRQILARAVLDCPTLDDTLGLLCDSPRSGGFHHTLAQVGDARLLSVELTPIRCSVQVIDEHFAHANHLVHEQADRQLQIVTRSSARRQARIDHCLSALPANPPLMALSIALTDCTDNLLPIYRCDPDDPDGENTLARAGFNLTSAQVELSVAIYNSRSSQQHG